jgi:hypothetical protein
MDIRELTDVDTTDVVTTGEYFVTVEITEDASGPELYDADFTRVHETSEESMILDGTTLWVTGKNSYIHATDHKSVMVNYIAPVPGTSSTSILSSMTGTPSRAPAPLADTSNPARPSKEHTPRMQVADLSGMGALGAPSCESAAEVVAAKPKRKKIKFSLLPEKSE